MFFDHVRKDPVDLIFGLQKRFKEDPRKDKLNFSIGVYRNAALKSLLFSCVEKGEKLLVDEKNPREYLPIEGDEPTVSLLKESIFGTALTHSRKGAIQGVQTVGGTGALRIGADFLFRDISQEIAISDPTWANHHQIFESARMTVHRYPYYDREKKELCFSKMIDFLSKLKEKTAVLLQASCHNPTGLDLDQHQWKTVSELLFKKRLIPFFDLAYQGLGHGLNEDAQSIRFFVEQGHECLVAYTAAKNFGIYSERVGALYIAGANENNAASVKNQWSKIIRAQYSNPPYHGIMIVKKVLQNPELKMVWEEELAQMRKRLKEMRELLNKKISNRFASIEGTTGFFIYTGFQHKEVDHLIEHYGIYLTDDGRLNLAGLSRENCDFVANALINTLER